MLIKLRTGEEVFLDDCCQIALARLLEASTDRGTPENDMALEIAADVLSSDVRNVQASVDVLHAIISQGLAAAVAEGS